MIEIAVKKSEKIKYTHIKNGLRSKLIALWDIIRCKDFFVVSFRKDYKLICSPCLTENQVTILTNFFISFYRANGNDNFIKAASEQNVEFAKKMIEELNKEKVEKK